jgi:hypothetical protein
MTPRDVAERVDDRGRDEPRTALSHCPELPGAQQHQPLQRRRYVIDMPVDDHTAWSSSKSWRGEPPVDDAELVLVVADAKHDVTRSAPGSFATKVRLDAEQLGVPARRRRQVLGLQVHRADPTQHGLPFLIRHRSAESTSHLRQDRQQRGLGGLPRPHEIEDDGPRHTPGRQRLIGCRDAPRAGLRPSRFARERVRTCRVRCPITG